MKGPIHIKKGLSDRGSALILTIVLASTLAIVGIMFLLSSRIEELSTGAAIDQRDLNNAVDTVIAKLSNELALDVPGIADQEYYDYPGENDPWLASIEPYKDESASANPKDQFFWGQISDLTGDISQNGWPTQDVRVRPTSSDVIKEYPEIKLDDNGDLDENLADADGDGIADSKWFVLDDVMTSKGQKIYAAIRVIDNGAMINVNTAYKFDEDNTNINRIDGSRLYQVNLDELGRTGDDANGIFRARAGMDVNPLDSDLEDYESEGAWKFPKPGNEDYRLFDVSDELELRHRFIVDSPAVTRNENIWDDTIWKNWTRLAKQPFNTDTGSLDYGLTDWWTRFEPVGDPNHDRRHLLTTYSIDRIIDPNGDDMTNINNADADLIRQAISDANSIPTDVNRISAQIAVNIVDSRDNDADVTVLTHNGIDYYGFEAQPFISELYSEIDNTNPANPANNDYALELYNPFDISIPLDDFYLSIDSGTGNIAVITLSGNIDANDFFVLANNSSGYPDPDQINGGLRFSGNYVEFEPGSFSWDNYDITLKRTVEGSDILMDHQETDHDWYAKGATYSIQRKLQNSQFVYQSQHEESTGTGTLGAYNTTSLSDDYNFNLPTSAGEFATVGDILRTLIIGPDTTASIGQKLAAMASEDDVRLNIADEQVQKIFQYLTNWDPPAEADNIKVFGRININTVPWFVIAQLPWMEPNIAQAVVNYRDSASVKGFKSIAELIEVSEMRLYGTDGDDLDNFPDLTPDDGAEDDFEERDVIFSRISNLATVRSDVFTAYILVRLGVDGPQKRIVAVLDRSDVYKPGGKVKIIARQETSYLFRDN